MTIMVTGGAGYIGSHMVHHLLDAGEHVIVVDNMSTGFRKAVPDKVHFYQTRVQDARFMLELIRGWKVDAIIHFAGSVVVPESVKDPLGYFENNTSATRTLLECAVKGGAKNFIFSSTAAVYGNPTSVPVLESAPTVPVSPYGASKLMSEAMLRWAGEAHGLRYAIMRYFNVAGADPRGRTGQSTKGATHLIKVAIETALGKRDKMQVFGTDYPTTDGTCVRDFIHVSDLVAAHADVLAYMRRSGVSCSFNCGYGFGYSVLEVIEAVKRISGVDFKVELAPRRPGDAARVIADADRLRYLSWRPHYASLDMIVESALAWERRLVTVP